MWRRWSWRRKKLTCTTGAADAAKGDDDAAVQTDGDGGDAGAAHVDGSEANQVMLA